MITGRELLLAVPRGAGTQAQWAALQALQQYAANRGVTLTIVQIPLRHPTQAEFRRPTPVQKAIGIRSWKKMAQAGVIGVGIWWTREKILVAFSPRPAKDVQEFKRLISPTRGSSP